MKKSFIPIFYLLLVMLASCQKELSQEQGNIPAEGSLQQVGGDCLPHTVNGTFVAGTALTSTNTLQVTVNVTKTGRYEILTDTVNGYFFRAAGLFTALGTNQVTLVGNGTPFVSRTDNFIVSFDSTFCNLQVDVSQLGVGTLNGAPNTCAPIIVNGAYSPGVALTTNNNAVVQINVTTAGSLAVSTDTVDGIWFAGSAVFSTGVAQNMTLAARGSIAPTATTGTKTFRVRLGASNCTFTVPFLGPAAGTLNCTTPIFNGAYTANLAMNGSNTVQLAANVTGTGAYSITTDTVNGVWFSASGNFSAAGAAIFTVGGNGIPINQGTFTYTLRWGTNTCTFQIAYSPALSNDYYPRTANSSWSYENDDDPLDSVYVTAITPTLTANANVFNIFMSDDGLPAGLDSAGYYRKNGGDYFEWINLEDYGADDPVWMEYIMLKDNVPANTNWKTPAAGVTIAVSGTPTKIRFSNTVLQKDVSVALTTSGAATPITYNNVIVVEQKVETEILPGVWQDVSTLFGSGKSYYARGIGLIKFELSSIIGNFTQELRRYQVF